MKLFEQQAARWESRHHDEGKTMERYEEQAKAHAARQYAAAGALSGAGDLRNASNAIAPAPQGEIAEWIDRCQHGIRRLSAVHESMEVRLRPLVRPIGVGIDTSAKTPPDAPLSDVAMVLRDIERQINGEVERVARLIETLAI